MDKQTTIQELLGKMFSIPSVPRGYKNYKEDTVALRFVGGDEKGSLETEAVKYVRESQGTRT
jgi:hypothetical protein